MAFKVTVREEGAGDRKNEASALFKRREIR